MLKAAAVEKLEKMTKSIGTQWGVKIHLRVIKTSQGASELLWIDSTHHGQVRKKLRPSDVRKVSIRILTRQGDKGLYYCTAVKYIGIYGFVLTSSFMISWACRLTPLRPS